MQKLLEYNKEETLKEFSDVDFSKYKPDKQEKPAKVTSFKPKQQILQESPTKAMELKPPFKIERHD